MLVPNAAVALYDGKQLLMSESIYDKYWDINVKSTFFLIKESIDLIRKAQSGANILIISSLTGKNPGYKQGIYAATKAALDNITKWLAEELREDGIRVNGLAPGLI